jgi:tRNA (guanine-N7-)-methyltransferase
VIELLSDSRPLDIYGMFGRLAPLHVDLGCGDGSFLAAAAQQNPHANFLGIERLQKRVRSAARKTAALGNARVMRADSLIVLRNLLPPESVETFYLLFPDPWPKRRHHRRRLVSGDFFSAIWLALIPAGRLLIATDHTGYFLSIQELAKKSGQFSTVYRDSENDGIDSTFGKRFRQAGVPIHWLELRKVSPVR